LEEKTFYDYINGKRIEEFKKMILRPENQKYTIVGLAYDCGFNSKTAFYRNFKNVTGLSPTQYLQQQNIQLSDN
jgi:AraC-like DNA-binding protein